MSARLDPTAFIAPTAVVLGDVTGKGVRAAALTSLVRYTARTAGAFDSSPSAVLAQETATSTVISAIVNETGAIGLDLRSGISSGLDGARAAVERLHRVAFARAPVEEPALT